MGSHYYISLILVLLSLTCINCEMITLYEETSVSRCLSDVSKNAEDRDHASAICLSTWLAKHTGIFSLKENKWNKQHIVDVYGADVYNYCRHELDRSNPDAFEHAHGGYQCIQKAEQNINKTKSILLSCANKLNADMGQLQRYIKFEKTEAIPCLFKCFADIMSLYTAELQRNSGKWIEAFGPVRQKDSNFTACDLSVQRKNTTDECSWMYEDYMCMERYIYNTEGLYLMTEE